MSTSNKDSRCHWCGEERFRLVCEAKDFDSSSLDFCVVKCPSCGLVRTEPFLTGDDLSSFYSQDYYGSAKAKFTTLFENAVSCLNYLKAKSVFKRIKAKSVPLLLDVGCGRGSFLNAISRYGVDCFGVEREDFPEDDETKHHLYYGDLLSLGLSEETFDTVTFWHVLEHLEEPRKVLDEAGRILKAGGLLVVAVPNYASWQARLFGKYWFHLDLPRHLHHFESDWLGDKLEKSGYNLEIVKFAEVDQSLFGFIQSFQNLFLRGIKPNSLYRLLQRRKGVMDTIMFLILSLIAVFLLPFAFLELFLASCAGKNCSLVVMARKT